MTTVFPYDLIDLTHRLHETIPSWDGSCGFNKNLILDYDECPPDATFRVHRLSMHASAGTHMDAPAHCIAGGHTIDQLPLNKLISPCMVLDVSTMADEHFQLQPEHILHFEQQFGTIPANTLLLIHTSWDKWWEKRDLYHNKHQFPSVSLEAAQLLAERHIVGLGIDTLSCDCPSPGFPSHKKLLENNIYLIENVTQANRLPATGAFVAVIPLKIEGGTESPVRLIGMIPHKEEKS